MEWEDDRATYISTWVLNTTKQKDDKWKKMVSAEDLK